MYNYGTEAREIEYSPSFEAKEVKKATKSRRDIVFEQRMARIKKSCIKSLAIVAAILAVVMIREAQIDKLCGEITKLEGEIYDFNAMITEREMHLSYQLDMNNIDTIAVSRLGMKKPDDSQYIYLDVQKNTGGEVLVKNSAGSNGFSAFVNKAKILLEYLY